MKTLKRSYYILLFAGGFLMAVFGSEITHTIAPSKSLMWHIVIPGYSVGLLMISGAMVTQLRSQVKELQSKVEKLENNRS
jgi:hypothetical protein